MVSLSLTYKGPRTYLHGTDIYNGIVQQLSGQFGGHLARLAFKHFARNQVELLLEPPEDSTAMMGNGLWTKTSGETRNFWIRETAEAVTGSYPFDEDSIITHARLEGQSVQGDHTNSYTVIENIVALTKKLNYALSPDVDGKWLFAQIDLKQGLPAEWNAIQIERTICVGKSFSRNRIVVDGTDYGEIRFIGGEP